MRRGWMKNTVGRRQRRAGRVCSDRLGVPVCRSLHFNCTDCLECTHELRRSPERYCVSRRASLKVCGNPPSYRNDAVTSYEGFSTFREKKPQGLHLESSRGSRRYLNRTVWPPKTKALILSKSRGTTHMTSQRRIPKTTESSDTPLW